MSENRSERVSVSLTPGIVARLDAYARAHHWSRSTAAAVLVQDGLTQQADNNTRKEDDRH
jgi:metal-responsive CopG/Arc/MetJ family transcriptional regulator